MSIGTGIFLSGVLLALMTLYTVTKDRWNWRKILLWPSGTLLVLATSVYLYSLIPEKPKTEKSFWQIPLGASDHDVLFIKGSPTEKTSERWRYIFNDENGNWKFMYQVNIKEGKVWAVGYFSAETQDWRETVQGITIGASDDEVRDKFGLPSLRASSGDGLSRIYNYSVYNLLFQLERNKVTALGIYSPEAAPQGVKFVTVKDEAKK